jgi:N-methylhydantoinase B
LLGGGPGAAGEFTLSDGRKANPKELLFHPASTRVDTALPGGGGYGNPFERDPLSVVDDVLNGYVSLAAAERDYGVVIRSSQRDDEQVSLLGHFSVDKEATEALRNR